MHAHPCYAIGEQEPRNRLCQPLSTATILVPRPTTTFDIGLRPSVSALQTQIDLLQLVVNKNLANADARGKNFVLAVAMLFVPYLRCLSRTARSVGSGKTSLGQSDIIGFANCGGSDPIRENRRNELWRNIIFHKVNTLCE